MLQVNLSLALRHAEMRVLAEEPRLATAAAGASRLGRVAIRHLVEGLIGQFGRLAQRHRRACHSERLRGVGRRRQGQKHPVATGVISLGEVPKPVISDLAKSSRQDVLKEAPEELSARQPLDAPAVGTAILPAESNMGLVHWMMRISTPRSSMFVAKL
jgi:hypothetical protein